MENPEEILHSLEEFAKMKPKDIPRELEEYLKFVAKTGDPVYQWSAIKSLFREKLINVITEFYESCSSVDIPPCPNVEMFNYDLMKNFILEKLDTFPSAPFTLQRICELLTSPRKEYTRIDKYMRALEKNILVVSTMEPGGRRTENGDGIMNGIESDHDHVPEPGNEINVEEMDDSPSWPQNIQSTNHISEHISFDNSTDNPENEYHVSSSNQEIVCVQYVSVEPLASEGTQIQAEEIKETDISVTITAVDVKKDDESLEATTPVTKSQLTEGIPKETTEIVNKQEILTEDETKMDIQNTVEPLEESSSSTSKDTENNEVVSDPLCEDILTKTTCDKPLQEPDPLQVASVESESAESESVSPETSVTSSENSPSESNAVALVDTSTPSEDVKAPSENVNVETPSNPTPEIPEDKLESHETTKDKKQDSFVDIDSTTKASEDDDTNTKDDQVSNSTDSEIAVPQEESKEEPLIVQETQKAEIDSSTVCENVFTETSEQPKESPEMNIPNEVCGQQEQPHAEEATKLISEEILKVEEVAEPKSVELPEIKPQEISLNPEEAETPMEVDVTPEEPLHSDKKNTATLEEPELSEPPV